MTAVVQRKTSSPPGCIVVSVPTTPEPVVAAAPSPPPKPCRALDEFSVTSLHLIKPCLAGLILSLWAIAVQPLEEIIDGHAGACLIMGPLLACVVLFIDHLVGCHYVIGFSGSAGVDGVHPLHVTLLRGCQTLLGNVTGAVIGATMLTLFLHQLEVDGVRHASHIMDAVVDSARIIADELPQQCFGTGAFAGFVLAVVSLITPTRSASTPRWRQWGIMWIACVVLVHFRSHLGIIDKSIISATATLNAVQPLSRSLGPNVFNYAFTFVGNILGAVVGRCAVEIVHALREPPHDGPTKDAGVMEV